MDGSEDMSLKEIVKRVKASHPDIRIGKKGLNEGMVNEIKRRLKEHKVVKIRIGADVEDRKSFAKEVADKVNAKLVEVRGYTFILVKEDKDDQV
ncbi:hypothetical protein SUSAZ_00150 [Sulfolobus acidocaldarius SUSAZ]|nr:hypothetical protein SUSAZ_00150 [Sulfolobus acidocaldarius SUSAZ]